MPTQSRIDIWINYDYLDSIKHKLDNPHFDEFEKKIALQNEEHDKTNKYKLTQKDNKISDQIV